MGDGRGRSPRTTDPKETKMDNPQRCEIGDRGAPLEVAASVQALDPSTPEPKADTGGSVKPPGEQAAPSGKTSPAVQESSRPKVQSRRVSPKVTTPSPANVAAIGRLESRQHDLRVRTRDVANGNSHALLVVGPGGLGKTEVVNSTLNSHPRINVVRLNSHCTPLALYEQLHKYKDSANVLVLEDMEETLNNKIVQGLLRSATDGPKDHNARKERVVRWNSTSSKLADLKLPDQFKFEAGIIIIANATPSDQVWKAFATRCRPIIFDATPEEVVAFMRHITRNGHKIDTATGPVTISAADCKTVVEYVAQKHPTHLRVLDHALIDFYLHRANDEWQGLLDRELASDPSQSGGSAEAIIRALAKSGLPVKEQEKRFTDQTGLRRSSYYAIKKRLGLI
jgi:hypothetical protein